MRIQPGVYCNVLELFRPTEMIDFDNNIIKLPDPGPLPTHVSYQGGRFDIDWERMVISTIDHKDETVKRTFEYKGSTLYFDPIRLL